MGSEAFFQDVVYKYSKTKEGTISNQYRGWVHKPQSKFIEFTVKGWI